MNPTTLQWLQGLRTFLAKDRRRRRHRATADPAPVVIQEVECLLAASLERWAAEELTDQLGRRAAWILDRFGSVVDGRFDPSPAIVLSTTPVGLAVAERVLSADSRGIICLLEVEYRRWCRLRPDESFEHHIVAWNWVKTRLPVNRYPEFAAHPLGPGENYWLHRTGIAGISDAEHRKTSLLAFDGSRSRCLSTSLIETRFE